MRYLIIAVTSVILFASYQQCSVGGESGVGNLSSEGPPSTLPLLTLDMATLNLATTATSFAVSGDCNVGPFSNFTFDTGFQETGANSSSTRSYPAPCNNERFSFIVQLSHLNIRPNFPGVLSVRIKATRPSGDVEGPARTLTISWGGSASGGTTSTGGTTGTTSTSGTTTGGTTTGCSPSCDPGRACGSTIDSCGTHTCAAQTASPPCAPPPGSGCQTLQQNMVCSSCGNYGQAITANAEECRVHCGSRSKCCEWDSNNGACTYYHYNVPANCHLNSAALPNIYSGMCY